MRTVGLKVLKNKLSEFVRAAAAGETVLITDRNHVIAELVPPSVGQHPALADAMLADAVLKGWISLPKINDAAIPPRLPIISFDALMKDLAGDREER